MSRLALVLLLSIVSTGGCKKTRETIPDSAPPPPAPSKPASGGNSGGSGGIAPAGGVGVVVNPSAAMGGGGGGGAVMASLKAARRAKAQAELDQIALLIEQLRDPFGKMPSKEQILSDLQRSAPNLLKAVQEGSYVLTGTTDGSGLWAYEVDGDKVDGVAVIGGRAQRTTAAEVKRYLGGN